MDSACPGKRRKLLGLLIGREAASDSPKVNSLTEVSATAASDVQLCAMRLWLIKLDYTSGAITASDRIHNKQQSGE